MIPFIETIITFITPIIEAVRGFINFLPWEPEINYAVVAGAGGYLLGRSSAEFMTPIKLGLIIAALIYIALMFV